jgi:O-antigen biosynthesis protein WbqP
MKRIFDVVAAAAGLILSSPFVLACMIWVRLDSEGPAILRQQRIGRDERPFTCYKLRTMKSGTRNAPSHEVTAMSVTKAGVYLRRLKLDELPQLWNVLKGEMSLVGPRPCLPTQTELILARRRQGLAGLRPGITGVSQVAGVDMSDPERLAQLDATYMADMSLAADLRLIWRTVAGAGRGDRVGA